MAASSLIALKAGAKVIANTAKKLSAEFSTRIPMAIHTYTGPGSRAVFISAGHRGGQWGWVPIHAWMFEEPHSGSIPKHPLFGNRKGKWYYQPYRPYMEDAAEISGQKAAETYADVDIALMAKEHGFK